MNEQGETMSDTEEVTIVASNEITEETLERIRNEVKEAVKAASLNPNIGTLSIKIKKPH